MASASTTWETSDPRRQRQAVKLHLLDHGLSPLLRVGLKWLEPDVVQKRQVRFAMSPAGASLNTRTINAANPLVMMASPSA